MENEIFYLLFACALTTVDFKKKYNVNFCVKFSFTLKPVLFFAIIVYATVLMCR
ncbi:hypothetical protein [Niallia alba]|uniref:hypothetical protein n=1 Tax=Niallia alba TaxID=2729105 RepID=UPI0039A13F2E